MHRYLLGLERVAKVVDGVGTFEAMLGRERLSGRGYDKVAELHAAGDLKRAASSMAAMIRNARLTRFEIPANVRLLSFANTQNNKVQLNFFKKKTAMLLGCEIYELSSARYDLESSVGHKFDKHLERALVEFLGGRGVLSTALLHQLVGYSTFYCSIKESLSLSGAVPTGVVLANDHSPKPVAISMVCAEARIKRVYLQHAEVTSIFPPLDFEYSILMDGGSRRTYENVGNLSGSVAVIAREARELDREHVFQRMDALSDASFVTVGIYTSAFYQEGRLRETIAALKRNPHVDRIFLKPHPSTILSTFAAENGVEYLTDGLDIPHIALIGNSSIAIKLATSGNLVFQDFAADMIARDYYGFLRDGLTAEVHLSELCSRFWEGRASDATLVDAVGRRIGEQGECLGEAEEHEFFRSLVVDIGGLLDAGTSRTNDLRGLLHAFPRAFFSVRREQPETEAESLQLVMDLDTLFNERKLDLNSLYLHVDPGSCRSAADFWMIVKRAEWSGYRLTEEQTRQCWEYVRAQRGKGKFHHWLEARLFDLILRMGYATLLDEFLDSAEAFAVRTSHLNKRMAFVNFCRKSADHPSLKRHYAYEEDELVGFERLKFRVQCMVNFDNSYGSYKDVESDFLKFSTPRLAEEYRRLVAIPYARIADRAQFIDVQWNADEATRLVETVVANLRAGSGLSLVRLSDGEGYLFQFINKFFTREDAENRERHWWGVQLDEATRVKVIESGLSAVSGADILGIPSIYRFVRDHTGKSVSLLSSLQGRGLVAVLQGFLDYAAPDARFGDDKLNRAVFTNRQFLEEMTAAARKVVVVNGAKEDVIRNAFPYVEKLDVISIPTHHKTAANDRFSKGRAPLPFMFEEVRERIAACSGPGVLVLIGGGIAGKSFMQAAKENAAVAVDLGSALDELVHAGIQALH